MLPTWIARYAVVKDNMEKRFTKWHETEEEAIEEAKRLCQKEGMPFTVLKEIGCATVAPIPAEFTRAK